MIEILNELLGAAPDAEPMRSIDGWWQRHAALSARFAQPIDVALAGGFHADRVGYAFGSGYVAAGSAMFGKRARGAFCASEKGGAHPRNIATTLRDGRLSGSKSFVTFGSDAELLYVVCSVGQRDDGNNDLRVVVITPRDGVTITPHGPTPFVPEIPHAAVQFDDVRVEPDEVLEGDGYLKYLKPFRTVEDAHVHAAVLAWLIRVGRRSGWSREVIARLAALACALRALALEDPTSPALHVALGGALDASGQLIGRLDWSEVDDDTRVLWERDRALLGVASGARQKRFEAAWRRLA